MNALYRIDREKVIVGILLLSFILQYNPFFSSEFLWKDYWTGSALRTGISLTLLFLCFMFRIFNGCALRTPAGFIAMAFITIGVYGLTIGFMRGNDVKFMLADSAIWFETAAYLILLGTLRFSSIIQLMRSMVVYTIFAAIGHIWLFWSTRDDVVIAALVGGERIVRLTDLQSPLMLIFLLYPYLEFSSRVKFLGSMILLIEIVLGFFRSVWAAFLISFLTTVFIYPRLVMRRSVMLIIGMLLLAVPVFEYIYFLTFNIPNVVSGRIMQGVGTADSLGRLSSTLAVLSQWADSASKLLFGGGFGAMAWFVNDFGAGELLALQPVGSISNYFVGFLCQVGLFGSLFAILMFWKAKNYWRKSDLETRRIIVVFFAYLAAQWLTFPSTIHYPTGMSIAIIIAIFGHRLTFLK